MKKNMRNFLYPYEDTKDFPSRRAHLGFLNVVDPVCQGLYPQVGLA